MPLWQLKQRARRARGGERAVVSGARRRMFWHNVVNFNEIAEEPVCVYIKYRCIICIRKRNGSSKLGLLLLELSEDKR